MFSLSETYNIIKNNRLESKKFLYYKKKEHIYG